MKQFLFYTDQSWAGMVLRLFAGFIMLPHGLQKMFGLFGGNGFTSTMNYFTDTMKLPWAISFFIIATEMFGAAALIAGFGGRIFALLFIAIMVGAIITTNYKNGFFMNWFGNQPGEGFEYHLLLIGICIALLITGSGRYAIDSLLYND
jgi:putative oxidoreductase